MELAALADIHGNRGVLEAVLEDPAGGGVCRPQRDMPQFDPYDDILARSA